MILVGLGRVELPTSPLSGVRSSHLSYRPGSFTESFPEPRLIGSRLLAASFQPNHSRFSQELEASSQKLNIISRTRLNVRPS
jgi:hypothetical protein